MLHDFVSLFANAVEFKIYTDHKVKKCSFIELGISEVVLWFGEGCI